MQSFEVPQSRRLLQCTCAIFWCLLSGGPIFGFAALKPILVAERVYEYTCDLESNQGYVGYFSTILAGSSDTAKCTNQDLKLNMMFSGGAALTNESAYLIGRVLDVYGPKVCGLIGAFFLYLACFVFIFANYLDKSTFVDPYLFGYAFLSLGGPFAFISSFQLSNSFPKKSGIILALITGAFDASSAVFLLYKVFYIRSLGSFTLDQFFMIYLLVPTFITVAQLTIMPWDSYKTPADNTLCVDDYVEESSSASEISPLVPQKRRDSIGDALKQPYAEEGEEFLVEHSGGIFGILHGHSAEFQLKTPWFYLLCMFATIMMLRINYFVATIGSQYTYLFGSVVEAERLNRIFDIALPLGGVVSVPFVGYFIDNYSTITVLAVGIVISVAIGIAGLFGSFVPGLVNVLLFVVYRPLFYTMISDFCAKIFGFDTFGTVYGAIICISGMLNFGQSLLDKLTHYTFDMNPTPVNVVLIGFTVVIGIATFTYFRVQARLYNQKKGRV